MAPGVCVRKGQMLLKLDLYHRCGLNKTFAASFHQLLQKQQQFQLYNNHHQQQSVHRQNRRHGQPTTAFGIVVATTDPWHRIAAKGYCTGTSSSGEQQNPSSSASEEVTVKYVRGLPHITVPLPSRNERCQFTLRPVTHSVGDFLEMLKVEDRGVDRATVLNRDGVRIASACSVETLMDDEFWLHLNDRQYYVRPPKRDRITSEELTRLGDVQALVAQVKFA